MASVHHFFKQKTVLVTGSTGFLAKVFVEKLLRIQSDVKKVYLLIRASDDNAAAKRFCDDIIGKDLFRVLRDEMGEDFDSYISEKVAAVAGDVSAGNLGLNDENLEKLLGEIQVIVNSAAVTQFDERFDVAMNVNTMGALNVLNFAKRCQKIQVLLHVSTAYVCGEAKDKEVVIREEPFKMGHALKKVAELDIHAELGFMKKRMQQLEEENADAKAISAAMKDYGLKRANLYGWPNTYVFTKAMGEMFLSHLKDPIPLVILRPTMVTSTYKEPFPGWIEGFRTVDAVIGGYGKGKLTCFLGNPKTILDLNNPLTTKNGKPLMIRSKATLASNAHFHMYLLIQYLLPLTGLNLANKVLCGGFQDAYNGNHRKIKMLTRMAELYKPYVFFKATFDDSNTEKLRKATTGWEGVGSIDWSEYLMSVHIPGLVKYAIK
ncbi:probable fatty acyl-CoA reductase 4 [Neltuma alba]|uniref:probable fatty acyl-CoA reductase 4 n=1 Tax=Neltuma alba TaxID=207710 RepID=UPI0010A3B197|nr:probable fatty acyl-CoA reductase 4 [Prosopis alba]